MNYTFLLLNFFDHFGTEAMLANPQVFPEANLIYPLSPHEAPQEFLIFQTPSEV